MSREQLNKEISKIRNEKNFGANTRFRNADVLDALNNEKFGAEDTYTREQINTLLAGAIQGDYVPMSGTSQAVPFTGTLYGKAVPTAVNYFSLGGDMPEFKMLGKTTTGDNQQHSIIFDNEQALISYANYTGSTGNIIDRSNFSVKRTGIELLGSDSTFNNNATTAVFNKSGLKYNVYDPNSGVYRNLVFDKLGLRSESYTVPTLPEEFTQKKYVDDKVAGIVVPSNFIPLSGSSAITGALVATGYYTPSSANAFIQKKYVDDKVSAIPTNFIPLSGSSDITGALVANAYFTPANANAFVQKKYVDDAVAGNVPTGFVPLAGTSAITGSLSATGYIAPINNYAFVQKQYVDGALNGFVPLGGTTGITGKLVANAYFTPSSANEFIQKKYVDDLVASIPQPTGFIPKAGANDITGALVATGYYAPSSANAFIQKKYVDDLVASIPQPTGFIPLTGSLNITGALVATGYYTPTSSNAFVQKKYVDDSVNSIGTNYIPMSGTTTNPVTGRITLDGNGVGGIQKVTIGHNEDQQTNLYGIDLYSVDDDGVTSSKMVVNQKKFNYTNDFNSSGHYAFIDANYSDGIELSMKNFRGGSNIKMYGSEVKISSTNTLNETDSVYFRNGHTGTSTPRPNDGYSPADFIQKDYHDFANSWELFNVRPTGGHADMDGTGVDMRLHTVMIKQDITASQTTVNVDVTNFSPRRIFKVEGICVSNNGLEETMLNTYTVFCKRSKVVYSQLNKPDHIELTTAMGDNWDGYVLLYITYIR